MEANTDNPHPHSSAPGANQQQLILHPGPFSLERSLSNTSDTNPVPMASNPEGPVGGNELHDTEPHDTKTHRQEPQFPQFSKLPEEIQLQIFTEAIGKPNIQLLTNPCSSYGYGPFTVGFCADRKCQGISGYRRLATLALVNRTAYTAVRLATEKNTVHLPFKLLNKWNRIDGAEDLVLINTKTHVNLVGKVFFHPHHQHLNRTPSALLGTIHTPFDHQGQAQKFRGIQKVAFDYDHHKVVHNEDENQYHYQVDSMFRCINTGPDHKRHLIWRYCPDEFCWFLNAFPDLREVHIALAMPRRGTLDRKLVDTYITNYYTIPTSSSLRRPLSVFHGNTMSYIEFHPTLSYHFRKSRRRGQPESFESFQVGPAKQAADMLLELQTSSFRLDTLDCLTPQQRRGNARMYQLSLARRERLQFKILIPVHDDQKKGWKGEQAERFLAEMKKLGGK